jgi:hypothetical protein
VKRIDPAEKPIGPITSDQLVTLGQMLSRHMQLQCAYCNIRIHLTVEGGELRLGSSPDLREINPEHKPKPRLLFYCGHCKHILGFIQGDEWSPAEQVFEPTRWDRLELEEL